MKYNYKWNSECLGHYKATIEDISIDLMIGEPPRKSVLWLYLPYAIESLRDFCRGVTVLLKEEPVREQWSYCLLLNLSLKEIDKNLHYLLNSDLVIAAKDKYRSKIEWHKKRKQATENRING